jgi:hypothetical protein
MIFKIYVSLNIIEFQHKKRKSMFSFVIRITNSKNKERASLNWCSVYCRHIGIVHYYTIPLKFALVSKSVSLLRKLNTQNQN